MALHLLNMSCENINGVTVAFDSKKCIIHILDLNNDIGKINETYEKIQPVILQKLFRTIENPCEKIRWFIYDSKGLINEYIDDKFLQINPKDPNLNSTFVQKMNLRSQFNKIVNND